MLSGRFPPTFVTHVTPSDYRSLTMYYSKRKLPEGGSFRERYPRGSSQEAGRAGAVGKADRGATKCCRTASQRGSPAECRGRRKSFGTSRLSPVVAACFAHSGKRIHEFEVAGSVLGRKDSQGSASRAE